MTTFEWIILSILLLIIAGGVVVAVLMLKHSNKSNQGNSEIDNDPNSTALKLENKIVTSVSDMKTSLMNNQNTVQQENAKQLRSEIEDRMRFLERTIEDSLKKVNESLETSVQRLQKEMKEKLDESSKNTGDNLLQVTQALGTMQERQKSLDSLSEKVDSLNNVLSNSSKRGHFGEVTLNALLNETFGDTTGIYDIQKSIGSKNSQGHQVIPDATVKLPAPNWIVCIDSKFSFVAYNKLISGGVEGEEATTLKKEMKKAMEGQIDKIATDYIVKDLTAPYALMFVPSDGIYAFIQSDDLLYEGVVKYARKKNVIICSPSTLQAILANISAVWLNYRTQKNLSTILKNMKTFSENMERFGVRWEKLTKDMDALSKDKSDLDTTVDKLITKGKMLAEMNPEIGGEQ